MMRVVPVTLLLVGVTTGSVAVAAPPTGAGAASSGTAGSARASGVVRPDTNVDPSMPVLKPRSRSTMPVVHPKATTTPGGRRDTPPTLVVPK